MPERIRIKAGKVERRPASEVILLGKIETDPEGFKIIKDHDPVRIEEA